ncbi:helix-turn-helix domain-containing protein [Spirulina major]|uniref:helix-turn-helix domain-containing protein n=1 Tax=Spirulina major TaxID=270636 RepID=UPI000A0221F9|nr:helix-turn-helix domain-containing protein [Spirulina major]
MAQKAYRYRFYPTTEQETLLQPGRWFVSLLYQSPTIATLGAWWWEKINKT